MADSGRAYFFSAFLLELSALAFSFLPPESFDSFAESLDTEESVDSFLLEDSPFELSDDDVAGPDAPDFFA